MQEILTQTQTRTDVMDPARAWAMCAALGLTTPGPGVGDPLPPFFHHLHFWDAQPPGALGRDGHVRVGGLIPDMGLPRRMWAGGRLQFHAPLRAGIEAHKVTSVDSVVRKSGRSGPLAFVTLRHVISQGSERAITEYQDLVYREDPDPAAPDPVSHFAPVNEDSCETQRFDTTLLFRYSALTFNGHRIHYDLDYCRDVEDYAGLVVHGPLLAQLLVLKAEREMGPLRRFSFRATAPLIHTETAELCRQGENLWVRGPDGRLCLEAVGSV